jgi:hypothetical protein
MQVSASMTALPHSMVIADTGHVRTQSPHPTHRKGVTWDLSEAAVMHSTREMMMPEVMKSFFMAVYPLKLVSAPAPDKGNTLPLWFHCKQQISIYSNALENIFSFSPL